MDIGEPERSGRHRLEDGAAPWLPLGGELDHAPAPAPPSRQAERPPGTTIPAPLSRSGGRPLGGSAPLTRPAEQPPVPLARSAERTPARPAGRPPTTAAPPAEQQPAPPARPVERASSGPTVHARAVERPPAPANAAPASAAPARPAPAGSVTTIPVRRDPLVDTDAVGLGKFNIGLVPASVTPPRTWKRAAWFAVLSSAGVLVGLVFAAIKLVGSGTPADRLGMPGYPTSAPIVTGFGTSAPSATAPPAQGKRGGGVDDRAALVGPERTAEAPATTASGTPAAPTPSAPSATPTVTTVPSEGRPVVDALAIAARTERFYEQATAGATTALEMVSDAFRADARALLAGRFGEAALIEVTEITVDPAQGVTVSTLQVRNKDGSTTTEKRQLAFTTTGDPLINAERLLNGV